MPTLVYPGVYVQEQASHVPIAGVATSTTAFIGRAQRGPVNVPVSVVSFADYVREFGGLWALSPMSYAVRDFFLNGGSQAIIVRLYRPATGRGTRPQRARLNVGLLKLEAASPGAWGEGLRAAIDVNVSAADAKRVGLPATDLFNLTVKEIGGASEQFSGLSFREGPRRVDRVLQAESRLVRWSQHAKFPSKPPVVRTTSDRLTLAEDRLAKLQAKRQPSKKAVQAAHRSVAVARQALRCSDGRPLARADYVSARARREHTGLYALERVDLFNLLCMPPYRRDNRLDAKLIAAAAAYCEERRAFLIVDGPPNLTARGHARANLVSTVLNHAGARSSYAALYSPWISVRDPHAHNHTLHIPPSGAVAGVYARTDAEHGVAKAPAGREATLAGVSDLSGHLKAAQIKKLNTLGVNCLRFVSGRRCVLWGAKTLAEDDRLKYVPVRRLFSFIEESIDRGTQQAVFEPNEEPLWAWIRLSVSAFLKNLYRRGALAGSKPQDAWFVRCGRDTMTQDEIDRGIVNFAVGVALVKPAEFALIRFQQSRERAAPYRNFRFRVKWAGRYVAGANLVHGLERAGQVRRGSRRAAKPRRKNKPVTLSRGVTRDADFVRWLRSCRDGGHDCRTDVVIESVVDANRVWRLRDAWPLSYEGPGLRSDANEAAVETIELEHEGLEVESDE